MVRDMENLFDLTGKTAVVIGGTSVLGSAMAVGLAEHGARVAIAGRNQKKRGPCWNKSKPQVEKDKHFLWK